MGARQKLNSVYLVGIVGAALFMGCLFQSPVIAILVGAALVWAAVNCGDIRPGSRRR